jgi:hypothetical protein
MSNIVQGDTATWTEAVFHGGSFSPWANKGGRYVGQRTITGTVRRSAYGAATTAHWLTIEVTASEGTEAPAVGTVIRRKARTVYAGLCSHRDGDQHQQQADVKRAQKLTAAATTGDPIRAVILRDQAVRSCG